MVEEEKHEHKEHEEHKVEHKEEHKPEHKTHENKTWRYTTIALIVVVILLLAAFLWPAKTVLSPEEASNKAVAWISNYFESRGSPVNVTLVNATKTENGVYQFMVNMSSSQGSSIDTYYISEDGKLFFPQYFDTNITSLIQSGQNQTQQQQYNPQKTDKPTAQLFVMAFCPYGIQAENTMKPVVDLLGSKADIQVHFIANVGGTTPDSVQSLHGTTEAQEDLRQVCIMKYYDQKTYWKYVMTIDANCSSSYSNSTVYETCWKDAATKAGIDVSKIDTCSKGTEGVNLLKADDDLSSSKGVSGSPTLIVNNATYNGARTPDAYKQAICVAFTTEPSECSQNLSATGSAASGGCAT